MPTTAISRQRGLFQSSPSAPAAASTLSGMLTRKSSVPRRTSPSAKQVARPPRLSAGITRSGSGWPAACAKPCPFPSRTSITTSSPNGLSLSTIWTYHLPSSHYRLLRRPEVGTVRDRPKQLAAPPQQTERMNEAISSSTMCPPGRPACPDPPVCR